MTSLQSLSSLRGYSEAHCLIELFYFLAVKTHDKLNYIYIYTFAYTYFIKLDAEQGLDPPIINLY